jgi:glucose/arabinose dehydrogenase
LECDSWWLFANSGSTATSYVSFSEPGSGGASTALGRGRLADGRLEGFQVIFRQEPKVSGPSHFGSRIVFAPDGKLFLTTGERYKFEPAQDVSSHLGVDRHGTGTLLDFGLSLDSAFGIIARRGPDPRRIGTRV